MINTNSEQWCGGVILRGNAPTAPSPWWREDHGGQTPGLRVCMDARPRSASKLGFWAVVGVP